ncbi:putative virion-associated RNA polymerase [Stenotrophomonas phage StenR_269]|nr:putative virion-associated RNA polymerase [Stenotrophomonas phage StenR_269]
MATKKPTTQSRLSALQAALDGIDDSTLDNDPLVAEQRARIIAQQEQAERDRLARIFSDTTSSVDSTADPVPERGWVGTQVDDALGFAGGVVDAVQGGLQSSVAAQRFGASDTPRSAADRAERIPTIGSSDPLGLRERFGAGEGLFGAPTDSPEQIERLRNESLQYEQAAAKNRQNVDKVRANIANKGFFANEVGEAILDAAESPTGALSLIGGPLAALGIEDARAREYQKARQAGLSREDANLSAATQAAPEAIGFIPAGRLLSRVPGLRGISQAAESRLSSALSRSVAQATMSAVGEGTGEAITTVAQLGMHKINSEFADSEELRTYAAKEVPITAGAVGEQVWRSFKAGAVMGGPTGAIEGRFRAAADAGRTAADFNYAMDDAITESKNAQVNTQRAATATQAASTPSTPIQTDMFGAPLADTPSFAEQEASRQSRYEQDALDWQARQRTFDQVEADRATTEDAQREDMFRQMELDRVAAENPGSPLAQGLARVGASVPRSSDTNVLPATDTVAPVSTPVVEPTQGELDVTTPQPRDLARQEVANVITKEGKKTLDAAKTKRAADRRKFREQQLNETRNLSNEDRITTVADRMVEWDRSNPIPTAESIAPTPAVQEAPAPVAEATTPETTNDRAAMYEAIDNAPEGYNEQEQVAALREFYPDENEGQLRQRLAKETGTPVALESMTSVAPNFAESTMEDVRKAVGKGIGKDTNSNVAAMLIGNNRVKLIDSDVQRPAGADPRGAAFYDGDGITIDVRRLNKNNIKGDLLLLMAHEGKHAADFSGAGKAGIESFIGKQANDRINASIQRAADNGDPTAQRAIAAAQDATQGDADMYAVELPAYFMNATRGSPRTGVVGAISRQIISPIRVAAKRSLGIDNVNLDDVHYLSDRLLENLAEGSESLAGNIEAGPLPTIYNESSTGFQQADNEGRTYTSVDGTRKYVLSDADSSMKPNGYQRLREATDPIPLGDLLNHEVLYREHPEAANIPVIAVDSIPGGAFAQWHGDTGEIYVAKNKMRTVSPRTSIMHEVQHFVQQQGGQQDNFFNDAVDPSGYAQTRENYEKALANNDRTSRLLLDRASQLRSAAPDAATFDGVLYDFNKADWQKAAEIVKMIDPAKLDDATAATVSRYEDSRAQANAMVEGVNMAADDKLAAYHRNITEREAFYTQDNLDVPQSELPLNPETEAMRTPRMSPSRPDVELTDGQIDVPRPLASMPASEIVNITPGAGVKGMDHKWWNAIKGAFDYTGGLGKDFDDMLQNSVGQAAHSAMQAQRNMHDLDAGMEAMAKRWNKSRPDIRNDSDALKLVKEEVNSRMNALEKIPDVKRRENALAAYVRDNPELRPLIRAYSDITQMSNDLADNLAASKVDLSKADKEFIQKIRDSGFGYTTRIYQTQTGEAGRKIARQFLKQNAAAQKRMDAGKTLSDKQREAVGIYTEAANYLINKIKIPSVNEMQKLRTSQINDLFNTWTSHDVDTWRANANEEAVAMGMDEKSARAHVKDSMINVLDGRREMVTTANLNAKAAATIRELLGVGGRPGAIAQRVGGLRQDRGILQKREDMAPQIERLMGRITTEPSVVLANTLAKQGELLARTKLLLDLRDTGLVVTKDVANTEGNEKFSHQLSGETAGPLDGMYTTPQIANVVNTSLEMYSSATDAMSAAFANSAAAGDSLLRSAGQVVQTGAAWAKLSSIVFDGYNLGLNFAGSPMMLAMNGVYNPVTAISGLKAGKDSVMNIFTEGGTKYNELLADGVKYQVVDSARAQELRSSTHQALKEKIVEGWPVASPAWHNIKKGKQALVETFSMSDAWVKLAAFKDRVDFLTEYYKAEGIDRTTEEIKTEAGNTVRDTNITYGKTPPGLRVIERFGLSTFMPYFYNVPRMIVKSTQQGAADVMMGVKATNPKAKQLAITKGVARLSGIAGAQAAMIMGVKAVASMLNDDNEEDVAQMKKVLRDDVRFADPIYLGKNAQGLPLFFRTSRVDPMGPVNDIIRTAMDDSIDADEKVSILGKQVGGMLFANRFVATAAETLVGTDRSKAPMRIERVPVLKDASGAWKNVMGYGNVSRGVLAAADSLLPGWIDAVDPNNPSLADGSASGDFAELLATLTKVSGGRVDKGDPEATLRSMAFDMKERKDAARLEVADRIFRDANPDGTARAIKSVNEDLYNIMARMTDIYEGMTEGMDYSQTKAMQVLKEAGGLDSVQVHNVRRGLPKGDPELVDKIGGVLSKKSLKEAGKRLQRGSGDESQAEYDARAKETLGILNDKYGMRAGE